MAVGDSACEAKLMSCVCVFLQVIRLPCYGQRETHVWHMSFCAVRVVLVTLHIVARGRKLPGDK